MRSSVAGDSWREAWTTAEAKPRGKVTCKEWGPHHSLSQRSGPCLRRHQGGLPLQPGREPLLLPPSPPYLGTSALPEKFKCSDCYSRTLSPGWPACPVLRLVSLLPEGTGCSGTLEQTSLGGTHAEVGLKPQLSPRGYVTREEELKSLLEGV